MVNKSTAWVCSNAIHNAIDASAAFHTKNYPLLISSGSASGVNLITTSMDSKLQLWPGRARTSSIPLPWIQDSGFCDLPL
jgi:hypothetical protein